MDVSTPTYQQALAWLREVGYAPCYVRLLPDGRIAWIHRLNFTYAILVAPINAECYEDRWCYHTEARAMLELERWNAGAEKEPVGWHRHPPSGRRRPDGDAEKEYVNP